MHDHDAKVWRSREQDVIASLDTAMASGGHRNKDAGSLWDGEEALWGCLDHYRTRDYGNFEFLSVPPAESLDDLVIRNSPGCVDAPDAIQQGVVAWQPMKVGYWQRESRL